MSHHCVSAERIGELASLAVDDPVRIALAECPRCASLLLSYETFIAAREAPGANTRDAEARLGDLLAREIEGTRPRRADGASGDSGHRSWPVPAGRRWLPTFAWSPVWVAAVVVLAVAVVVWRPWQQRQELILRGGPAVTSSPQGPSLRPPVVLGDGAVQLGWEPIAGADAYEVRFYGADLNELQRFGPVTQTSTSFYPSDLPDAGAPAVFYRIVALQHGDEIGISAPGSIKLH